MVRAFCLTALVGLGPSSALANAVIHVRCSDSCKIKIDGKRGEKVSDSEYRYDQIEAGIFEVDVSHGFEGGWIDVPAEGEMDIQVDKKQMTVNGVLAMDKKAKKQLEKDRKELAEREKKNAKESKDKDRDPPHEAKDHPKASKTKIAVIKIVARTGLEQAAADLFSDALIGELRKRPGFAITDRNDVATAIGAEKDRQLLGCDSASCIAEIGGALGVEQLIHGTVGRIGKSLIVNLTLVDAKKAQAIATVSERLKSASDEAFFDALPGMVDQLIKASHK